MKNIYLKITIVLLFIGTCSGLFGQNIGINTTGTTPSINAILDLNTGNSNNLGLIIPNVTLGALLTTFNPPIANAPTAADIGMMVFNTGGVQPIGYYYWNGATWVAVAGVGGPVSADNGLSVGSFTAGNVELGGTIATPSPLKGNSVISGNNFSLDFDMGTYSAPGIGSFLVTNGGLGSPLLSVTSNTPGVGINVNPAVSTLDVNGSYGVGTIDMSPAANSSTALTNAYSTIIATPPAVGNTYTLALPSATANPRRIYTIIYNGGILGTIDITSPVAGSTILNGVANPVALTAGSVTLQSDGTNWYALGTPQNIGQQVINVESTGSITNPGVVTLIPGMTSTFTIISPANMLVNFECGMANNTGLIRVGAIGDMYIVVDGFIVSYSECGATNDNASQMFSSASGTYSILLAAGTHTVLIAAADRYNGCIFGGNNTSILMGTMTITLLHQ